MDCPGSRFLLWALGSFLAFHSQLQASGWRIVLEMQRRDTQLIPPKRVTCMPQNFTHVKRHYPHHWPWRAARQDHFNLLGLNRLCKQFRIERLGITKSRHFSLCRNGVATSVKGCVSFAVTHVPPKHLVCRYCGLCSFLKSAEICLEKKKGSNQLLDVSIGSDVFVWGLGVRLTWPLRWLDKWRRIIQSCFQFETFWQPSIYCNPFEIRS